MYDELELGDDIERLIAEAWALYRIVDELDRNTLVRNIELGLIFRTIKKKVKMEFGPVWQKVCKVKFRGISKRKIQLCMQLSRAVPLADYPILGVLGQATVLDVLKYSKKNQTVVDFLSENYINTTTSFDYQLDAEDFRLAVENLIDRLQKRPKRKNGLASFWRSCENFLGRLQKLVDDDTPLTWEGVEKLEKKSRKMLELVEELKKQHKKS